MYMYMYVHCSRSTWHSIGWQLGRIAKNKWLNKDMCKEPLYNMGSVRMPARMGALSTGS